MEKKFLNGECILDSKFQNYDSHFVIELSSDEHDDNDDKAEEEDNSFKNIMDNQINSDLMKSLFEGIQLAVNSVMDKNKSILKTQYELCDDYIKKRLQTCDQSRTEFDNMIAKMNENIKAMKKTLYDPYTPVVTNSGSVDLEDMENVCGMKSMKQKTNLEIEVEKVDNKDDNVEDVIAITSAICQIPSDLPKEGPLEYPPVCEGQLVYAMKLTLLQPWLKCKIKSVINDDYVHIKFDSDEKLLMMKEIAYSTPSPVQFPVGSRIISKFKDVDSNVTDTFYAGVIAEPPKLLNQFR